MTEDILRSRVRLGLTRYILQRRLVSTYGCQVYALHYHFCMRTLLWNIVVVDAPLHGKFFPWKSTSCSGTLHGAHVLCVWLGFDSVERRRSTLNINRERGDCPLTNQVGWLLVDIIMYKIQIKKRKPYPPTPRELRGGRRVSTQLYK